MSQGVNMLSYQHPILEKQSFSKKDTWVCITKFRSRQLLKWNNSLFWLCFDLFGFFLVNWACSLCRRLSNGWMLAELYIRPQTRTTMRPILDWTLIWPVEILIIREQGGKNNFSLIFNVFLCALEFNDSSVSCIMDLMYKFFHMFGNTKSKSDQTLKGDF